MRVGGGDRVVVTTTTFYTDVAGKDKIRLEPACELVERARDVGHDVVIVDGSPISGVARKLRRKGARVFTQVEKGMGAARREVWQRAERFLDGDTEAILWTEEKPDIIRSIPDLLEQMSARGADIAIPFRTPASWETYPGFQRESEQIANLVYNGLFSVGDERFDPMFGPVLFRPAELVHFAGFAPAKAGVPDTYVQQFIPAFLRAQGRRVISVEVEFIYPPKQRAEEATARFSEMLDKRLWQLKELITSYFIIHQRLKLIL